MLKSVLQEQDSNILSKENFIQEQRGRLGEKDKMIQNQKNEIDRLEKKSKMLEYKVFAPLLSQDKKNLAQFLFYLINTFVTKTSSYTINC